MLLKIRIQATKVRRPNSGQLKGDDKFTGAVNYSLAGTLNGKYIRFALGTDSPKRAALRLQKIEECCAVGPFSPKWAELKDSLPRRTFEFFAKEVGYTDAPVEVKPSIVAPTWTNLVEAFKREMFRMVENKKRGAQSEEGVLAESTRQRYEQTIAKFTAYAQEHGVEMLGQVTKPVIALFKIYRLKQIEKLTQSRGGSSVALDIAILHRVFAFGIESGFLTVNPINLKNESKPGKQPKNGARPFTAEELTKLREHAGQDLPTLLVLRWTGLRGSDAVALQWKHVYFDRGTNGEIEILTQKRQKIAAIPLSTELRDVLEDIWNERKSTGATDYVLHNPDTNRPFLNRKRLYMRMKSLGNRAGIERATPHCYRDTFACDMLARGASIFDVAKMLADTVDTVEKHYAQFVQATKDAVQHRMDNGLGIEERARLSKTRNKKVAMFRATA